ncbi:MAG: hypothetical protein KAI84_10840 [Gammaproteobacteria bacterium]|nr:hypothetical protein [Gammaproteobacteria bacterium]
MLDEYKNEFIKRFSIAVSILFDTIILIFVLLCFFLINYVAKILGFENEIVSSIIHEFIHPILLLSIFGISILNILHEHLPKRDSKTRFELIHETDTND